MFGVVEGAWRGGITGLRRTRTAVGRAFPVVAIVYTCLLLLVLRQAGIRLPGEAPLRAQPDNRDFTRVLHRGKAEVVFFLILCEGKAQNDRGDKQASAFTRQLRQSAVLLKSAAALTSTTLRFLVVADSQQLFHRFTSLTSEWPVEYQQRVVFEWHPVWYPDDREDMRTMFRTCATERLFLPDMFPSLDAAIYIDTDMVFMRPPEDLWREFYKFDEKQLAAMAPCLYHYGTAKNKVPYYGTTGLNAGVMHMNLTRMKNFPGGGWIPANMKVFDQFKKRIRLADQDILNILFHKHPDRLYELGCEWNFRIFQCTDGNKCPAAEASGISILHGNAMAFVSGTEMKLQVVFEAWEQHRLGDSLGRLLSHLEEQLKSVSQHGLPSKCARTPYIDDILTKQLKRQISSRHVTHK